MRKPSIDIAETSAGLSSTCRARSPTLVQRSVPEQVVDRAIEWLGGSRRSLVLKGDEAYPALLSEIADPPVLLFAEGDVQLLGSRQLSVVGTRRATTSGRKAAMLLAADLARAGLTITSGLARGIDAAAHQGALEAGGYTIAVLGCGADVMYPRENWRLAAQIVEEGLIVSELPLGTPALPWNFPQRNRIVTGMTIGTLVVEAAERSGSLISARLAAEQGRDVFAVPGSIFNAQTRGCHRLIREGAKLTESVADIIAEFTGVVSESANGMDTSSLTSVQVAVMEALGPDPSSVDEITLFTSRPVAEVLGALVELEIYGFVASDAAGYYIPGTLPGRS